MKRPRTTDELLNALIEALCRNEVRTRQYHPRQFITIDRRLSRRALDRLARDVLAPRRPRPSR